MKRFRKGLITALCVVALSTTAQAQTAAYTENDLYTLSHIMSAEAGNCGWFMLISVGSVVLNRVADDRFPDTLEEVVFQQGQYQPTWDGRFWDEPTPQAAEAAKYLLENGSQLDGSVIWQAEFPQGYGIYDTIESPFGTTMYFCY